MGAIRTVYRGYAICITGVGSSWSFLVEPTRPDLPILANPKSDGHLSWGKALKKAKQQVDLLLLH